MKLFLTQGWKGSERLVAEVTTATEINQLINSLDWNEFNGIRLEHTRDHWIEVSGNLNEDGLAIIHQHENAPYVLQEASTIADVESAFSSFLSNLHKSGQRNVNNTEGIESADYESWKKYFKAKKKGERHKLVIVTTAAAAILLLIGCIAYLYFTDELKFVGRLTDYAIGTVAVVEWKPLGGKWYQVVTYSFEVDGQTYNGEFTGTKITGKHAVGDQIKIKFAVRNPAISKRVSTLRKTKSA